MMFLVRMARSWWIWTVYRRMWNFVCAFSRILKRLSGGRIGRRSLSMVPIEGEKLFLTLSPYMWGPEGEFQGKKRFRNLSVVDARYRMWLFASKGDRDEKPSSFRSADSIKRSASGHIGSLFIRDLRDIRMTRHSNTVFFLSGQELYCVKYPGQVMRLSPSVLGKDIGVTPTGDLVWVNPKAQHYVSD